MNLAKLLTPTLASALLAGTLAVASPAFAQTGPYSPKGPVTTGLVSGGTASVNTTTNTVTFTSTPGGPTTVVNLNTGTVTVNGQTLAANSPAAQQAIATARGLAAQYSQSASAARVAQSQAQQLAQKAASCGSATTPKCKGLYQQAAVAAARAQQLQQKAATVKQKLQAAIQHIAAVIKPGGVPSTGFGGTAPSQIAASAPAAAQLPGGAGSTVEGTTFTGSLANLRPPAALPKTGGAPAVPTDSWLALYLALALAISGFGLRLASRKI